MRFPPFYSGPASRQPPPEYGTEAGASRLAEIIMTKWRSAGHTNVYAWPERVPDLEPNRVARFTVRTNLVAGLPPRQPTIVSRAA